MDELTAAILLANVLLFWRCGCQLNVGVNVSPDGELLDAFWTITQRGTGVTRRV